jgi:hypothetical protein
MTEKYYLSMRLQNTDWLQIGRQFGYLVILYCKHTPNNFVLQRSLPVLNFFPHTDLSS